jgi:uncharacterized protein YcfJ
MLLSQNSVCRWLGFSFLFLLLVACSGKGYRPVVDFKASPGKNTETYERDLWECQHYAEQINSTENAGKGALAGAAVGSVTTGAVGAILGRDFGKSVAVGAAAGGIGGGVGGTTSAAQSQKDIIRNCLRGRGYSILH